MSGTKEVTVVADGISYVLPGQSGTLPPGQTYAYGSGVRGQDIEVRAEDYDRLIMLGAVVDTNAPAAQVAKAAPRKGQPGPDQVALAATPEAKLLLQNEAERFLDLAPDKEQDPNAVGVRSDVLAKVDPLDGNVLAGLNVTELRLIGNRYGVAVEADDDRDSLTAKIQQAAGAIMRPHDTPDTGGQATGTGFTGTGGDRPAPKAAFQQDGGGGAAAGKAPSRMSVKELDAAYGDREGYPADGNRADKREFAAKQQASS